MGQFGFPMGLPSSGLHSGVLLRHMRHLLGIRCRPQPPQLCVDIDRVLVLVLFPLRCMTDHELLLWCYDIEQQIIFLHSQPPRFLGRGCKQISPSITHACIFIQQRQHLPYLKQYNMNPRTILLARRGKYGLSDTPNGPQT